METAESKLTSQGQVSVPAAVRRALGLTQGSVLEWKMDRGRVFVERGVRHTTQQVHEALFPEGTPTRAVPLAELKEGIRANVRQRRARG